MVSNEFKIKERDKFVYVKSTQNGYLIVGLYVDGILIMDNNDTVLQTTKEC